MNAKFVPNDKGISAFLNSHQMQAVMLQAADNVKSHVETIAPSRTGAYKQRFHTEPAKIYVPLKYRNQYRAGAYVYNDSSYARYVETHAFQHKQRNTLSSLTKRRKKR